MSFANRWPGFHPGCRTSCFELTGTSPRGTVRIDMKKGSSTGSVWEPALLPILIIYLLNRALLAFFHQPFSIPRFRSYWPYKRNSMLRMES